MAHKLVLLHGALGAGEQLGTLAQSLSSTYEVQVYEFPGHGKRVNENIDFTIESLTSDFHGWLRQHHSGPVKVFGYSMGGYVCLHLAAAYPRLFENIVTLGTKFRWSVEESAKETKKLDAAFLQEKAPVYCDYLKQLHGEQWQAVLEKTATLMTALGKKPLLNEVTLSMVETPVHLLLGELDKMVTREETEEVQKHLKNSRFEIVPGFVHPLERLDTDALGKVLSGNL